MLGQCRVTLQVTSGPLLGCLLAHPGALCWFKPVAIWAAVASACAQGQSADQIFNKFSRDRVRMAEPLAADPRGSRRKRLDYMRLQAPSDRHRPSAFAVGMLRDFAKKCARPA